MTEKLWEEKLHKYKRVQSAESLFDERAKWKEGLRYIEEFDPQFRRGGSQNDPWMERKATTFYKGQPEFKKEGPQKDRLKKARSTTQLPTLRVEEYLKSMRGKD